MAIDVRGVCTLVLVFDMPTSLKFYRDVLGFDVRPGPSGGIELTLGPARITLGRRDPATDPGRSILFFQTDDAWKTHAELKERGVEITEEPVDRGYGIDFGLRDPFGNHLRIAQMKQG